MRVLMTWLSVVAFSFLGSAAKAETKVELKGVHLCCGACVKAIGAILEKEGCTGKCDQKEKTVSITADDDAKAKKALSALKKAGFYGESDNEALAIKKGKAPSGKVTSLTVTGAHNCCGMCCKALQATVKKVDGVTGDTVKPRATSFEVTGDFDAGELVKALNAAGFSATVKK